jgi:hypothetical protein
MEISNNFFVQRKLWSADWIIPQTGIREGDIPTHSRTLCYELPLKLLGKFEFINNFLSFYFYNYNIYNLRICKHTFTQTHTKTFNIQTEVLVQLPPLCTYFKFPFTLL